MADGPHEGFLRAGAGHRGGERWRIPSGRAAPRAELAGIRRQLGDRRQNRLSFLQGRAHAALARRRLGHSRLQWGRARRLADLGRIRRRQTHSAVHRELRPEGIGSGSACASWRSRPALCPTPSSEGMPSTAIRGILAYPQPTSFRAWLRLRVRPTSRTQSLSLPPTRIDSRAKHSSSPARALKLRPYDQVIEEGRPRLRHSHDSHEEIETSAGTAERGPGI